jgi:DNA (cytosine-5)-methyltransferase 1
MAPVQRRSLQVAGLFAGIGGIEHGLHRAGHKAGLLCENDPAARAVLADRFPGVLMKGDVRDLRGLPRGTDVLAAGFPCTDISQAGRTAGLFGSQSGLVSEVFRLIRRRCPEWLLIENVQNMLVLSHGAVMASIIRELEDMRLQWAYRVVDSRFTGVPQRRRRVILVASRANDPREVLFADDAGPRPEREYRDDAFGFYWTEGLRGLGWAQDATPTLKGGSTIGIASPPGVWLPYAAAGRKLITPTVEDAERLQGFPAGWTAGCAGRRTTGVRLKLIGNAVSVGVSEWVGERLAAPGGAIVGKVSPLADGAPWPGAAWGDRSARWAVAVSEYPRRDPYRHLTDVIDVGAAPAVSHRAAAGFLGRARRAKLRFVAGFISDVEEHVKVTSDDRRLAEAG